MYGGNDQKEQLICSTHLHRAWGNDGNLYLI